MKTTLPTVKALSHLGLSSRKSLSQSRPWQIKRLNTTQAMSVSDPDVVYRPGKDLSTLPAQDLIARISCLEAQLKQQTQQISELSVKARKSPPPSPKPKKDSKVFDPSRYATRLIALKFSYFGQLYNGLEHANGGFYPLPTVEEVLWKALRKARLISPEIGEGADDSFDVVWDTQAREKVYAMQGQYEANQERTRRLEVNWDGCEYSKCGRTDKGVSAFGQVVGVRVRSKRPKEKEKHHSATIAEVTDERNNEKEDSESLLSTWDDARDELPYMTLLNTILPPSIRILAWAPHPPPGFDARFSCLERQYKYFFTNPAFCPTPGPAGLSSDSTIDHKQTPMREGYLDIEAMQEAASKLVGLHDYRNLCKIDASKQMPCCQRRVTHASVTEFTPDPTLLTKHPHLQQYASAVSNGQSGQTTETGSGVKVYTLNLHGSAFLWHQVRCIAAVLFLVGQRLEHPSIIDTLLDIEATPRKPQYEMADDAPLVLWDCIFPGDDPVNNAQHPERPAEGQAVHWLYAGDENTLGSLPGTPKNDGKFGLGGLVEDLWEQYKQIKLQEAQVGGLLNLVLSQGDGTAFDRGGSKDLPGKNSGTKRNTKIFNGSTTPKQTGKYVPLLQRPKMPTLEEINMKYRAGNGAGRIAKMAAKKQAFESARDASIASSDIP